MVLNPHDFQHRNDPKVAHPQDRESEEAAKMEVAVRELVDLEPVLPSFLALLPIPLCTSLP